MTSWYCNGTIFCICFTVENFATAYSVTRKQVASNVNWTSPPHKWRTKLFLTCFTYGTSLENGAAICKPFLLLYQGYVLIPHQTANCCLSTVYCREVSVIPNYS